MTIEPKVIPVLFVALITWGGVFLYLLRIDLLTRRAKEQLDQEIERKLEEDSRE